MMVPDQDGNYMDISDSEGIRKRFQEMSSHMIKRIDWFLSLDRNKENKSRIDALVNFKTELDFLR